MKSLFLFFNTDYLIEMKKGDVKDGRGLVGDKEFLLKEARPFYVKTAFGTMPCYLINAESLVPMEPKDFKVYETPITPEIFKRSIEMKFFNFLLKRFRVSLEGVSALWITMAVALGMIVMYVLIMFKVIPI